MGIPSLITSTNFNSLGNDINIVGTFASVDSISNSDKYVSPMLLNYVEPYSYQGTDKTLFYTEVNTNLKEGDRVFIINGNYDSNKLIELDKYKKGRDGYKVLFVDYCKIVLDIDYTGYLPNKGNVENGDNMADYIKVYYIDSYDSFLLANKQLSTRNGTFNHKFDYYQNNIAFIDNNYNEIDNGWVYNKGITASPGFYVKNPTQSCWSNITTEFINSGSYSLALAPSFNFPNNGKLKVMAKSFTYNGFEFKSDYVYTWDPQNLTWKVDVEEQSTFTKAIISKSNFRDGDFKGSFNSGVYGSKSKKIIWNGTGLWNGGTLLNTSWKTGSLNSNIILPISYQASIKNGSPYQKINTYNNGGYGFNYIIESDFESSSIYSSIIRNAKFGGSEKLPVIENHIMSYTQSFDNVIVNGLFESSDFSNVSLIGGAVKNIRSRNSKFTDVKIINSFIKDSVIYKSSITADSVIKIDGYDELNNSERRNSSSQELSNYIDFKVYRFYIGESDFLKFREGDSFYIKGIKIKNDKNVINFFDKKFTIGNWVEYIDDYDANNTNKEFYKRGIECAAFLCTPEENEWIYNSTATSSNSLNYYTEAIIENSNPRYSIDIFYSLQDINKKSVDDLNFDYATQSSLSSTLERPTYLGNIDISDAYIIDSNIEGSLIDNSTWNSGFNVNYNNDVTISSFTNSNVYNDYKISINSQNQLIIETEYNHKYPEVVDISKNIKVDDIIYLNPVDYYSKGKVLEYSIISNGSSYINNNSISPSYSISSNSNKGYGLIISNESIGGLIGTVNIVNPGLDYEVGDILYLSTAGQGSNASGTDAIIQIDKVDTNIIRISDTYKVIENSSGILTLSELVIGTTSIISGLTTSGVFRTIDAENRWVYLNKTRINNSRIKSGFFRRSYITNSIIQDTDYDSTDKDYNNMNKIKNLVLSDIIYSNNNNMLSNATYLNSSILKGSDIWDNGIIQNSILNGITFNRGIIKESTWLDGIFNDGTFYNSRSYNAATGSYYYNDNIKSYYKSGNVNNNNPNNRYSWRNGQFNGGTFYKSDWENGQFNDGLFVNSKWYNGLTKGGIFGDFSTSVEDTIFYNGTIDYTIVNNAKFFSDDSSMLDTEKSIITWNDGVFNGGVFGSNINNTIKHEAIWNNGVFNGGQVVDNAVWKDGIFNGGKFLSSYGWTQSGSYSVSGPSSSYTWQGGVFNGGEFGNGSTGSNSTWFFGEFNYGSFKGRVWNDGVFRYGDFTGSGENATGGSTANGGYIITGTGSNAQDFVNSYTQSFYGLWRKGIVTNKKDVFINDKKFYTEAERSDNLQLTNLKAKFKNVIWKDGEFNNPDAEFNNSIWLGGSFKSGNFNFSSFNPYINGNFNTSDSNCYWENGEFIESDFYYSKWFDGKFTSGTASGMIWENGTSYYMNAYNILWKDGVWKNGNWNGSIFTYNGNITNDYQTKILNRLNSDNKLHIWNIFEDVPTYSLNILTITASSINTLIFGNTNPSTNTTGYDYQPTIVI